MVRLYEPRMLSRLHRMEPMGSPKGELAGASGSNALQFCRMQSTERKQPRVIIVGAGFGGLEAAKKLACEDVRLTVIDRTNYHLFQPLLYQVATAALSPADIASPIRGILRRQDNVNVILAKVSGIDTAR